MTRSSVDFPGQSRITAGLTKERAPLLLLEDNTAPEARALLFSDPVEVLACSDPVQLTDALAKIEAAAKSGLWAAGFLTYEAGYLLEPNLMPLYRTPGKLPLLWFGFFEQPEQLVSTTLDDCLNSLDLAEGYKTEDLGLSLSRQNYLAAIARIKELITAGDVYQINYTLKHLFNWSGNPLAFYRALRGKQKVAHGGFLRTEDFAILSRSPELFIGIKKRWATCRPMKGTAPRGRTNEEDREIADWLRSDEKSRAENLMIVDLLRNDLSRVSEIGSVSVDPLFAVERYSTLHQMTSTVTGRLKPGIGPRAVLENLFPCGSITGAPKVRAMEIIHELEPKFRGLYTGSLGYFSPEGNAHFNVAIRTLVLTADGKGEMGIGSGIVFDSDPEAEFEECLLKAHFLNREAQEFELIETFCFDQDRSLHYLEEHLDRLEDSAAYFSFPYRRSEVLGQLRSFCGETANPPARVRLLLDKTGRVRLSFTPLAPGDTPSPLKIRLADQAVDSSDTFLFHKTTQRDFYDQNIALAQKESDLDDLLFVNERGEVTEATRFNLFLQLDDRMVTPPVTSGLLPGVLRRHLLDKGKVEERVIRPHDLKCAQQLFLGNSVRGLIEAQLLPTARSE
jgi:para-aminobenzoate synthetase/4-amino-4-deoxychorismate lyase